MNKLTAALLFPAAMLLVSSPALAGEDSTDRYWGYGPAWYETPCGLACFRVWQGSDAAAGDVTVAAVKHVETPAQMRRLIDRDQ